VVLRLAVCPEPCFPYCGTTVMVVARAGTGQGSPSVLVGRSPSVRTASTGAGRLVDIGAGIWNPCRHLCNELSTCVSSCAGTPRWRSLGAASLFSFVMVA
jgi:hypothetical protein